MRLTATFTLIILCLLLLTRTGCSSKKKKQLLLPTGTGTGTGTETGTGTGTDTSAFHITTTQLPDGTISILYNATLTAANGTEPYFWTILGTGDSLPANISLDCSTGVISGTNNIVQQRNLRIQVEDTQTKTAWKDLTLNIFSSTPGRITSRVDIGKPDISGISSTSDTKYDWGASVLQLDNGTYQMWWTRNDPGNNFDQIQFAWSSDGTSWYGKQMVLQPENTLHETLHTARPSVVLVNGTYYMVYESLWQGPIKKNSNVNLATSNDGINWTKYPRMIPGREGEQVQSIVSYYPTHDNDGYGVGQPSLTYVNNEFVMYYVDGTSTTGFGVPFNAMRRAATTDPFAWGDPEDHPVALYNAGTEMTYCPSMGRMISTWFLGSNTLPNPPDERRMDIYVAAAVNASGTTWNPQAAWHWDNDAYRVTADEPEALTRISPNFFRNEEGVLLEQVIGNSTTFTIIYTDGDLAPAGEDFKVTWPTWDLHMKSITFSW